MRVKININPWLFILPALLIYLVNIVIPSCYTLFLSFFKWNGVAPHKEFVGLSNYISLIMNDTVFLRALKNNLFWTIGSLIFMTGLGLALALILNQNIKGRLIFRTIFYFPFILSGIVVAIIWRWIYNPSQGVINGVLESIGLSQYAIAWLGEPKVALIAVFVAAIWHGVGLPMVLFLAGLQTLPKEPYEAAIVDGANPIQSFWHITIPLLRETFIIAFATIIINSMKVYDIIYAMTGGGPAESTQVLTSWMYYQTFRFANIGIGSAISWILISIMMLVIIPYVFYTTKKTNV